MKSLVLVSGGMDSATALAVALHDIRRDKRDVAAISFRYDSKHNERETVAAIDVGSYYGILQYVIRVPSEIFEGHSTLMKGGREIPNEEYHDADKESPSSTVVPFRNAVFLSMAVALAEGHGFDRVYLGAHSTDSLGFAYPDCSPEFLGAFAASVYIGTLRKVRLITPFANLTKADVVSYAAKLGAPLHLTYSCYRGGDKPCGACPTCRERAKAFADAGYLDPGIPTSEWDTTKGYHIFPSGR